MRAAIPDEWLDMINEKIYLDMEIDILINRIERCDHDSTRYKDLLKIKHNQRADVNAFLRKHSIRIEPPEKYNEEFVKYYYSCKMDGGYKEGYMTYWISAIKYKLNKRLNGG
jgi:hypothetical protein